MLKRPWFWIATGLTALTLFVIPAFAWNVREYWSVWYIALGILLGGILSKGTSKVPFVTSSLACSLLLVQIGHRAMPVHSLDWDHVDKIEISPITDDWNLVITDPQALDRLKRFGAKGAYMTMHKHGNSYQMRVWENGNSTLWYVHGDAIGESPGICIQTIFVPSESGFTTWFEALIKKGGH